MNKYLCAAGLTAAVLFLVWVLIQMGYPVITIPLLCAFCIVANFYVSVWLVRKNDSMVGGMPKATYSYFLGFCFLAFAYTSIAASLLVLDNSLSLRTAGVASILAGQITLVFANKKVFSAIAREGLTSQ